MNRVGREAFKLSRRLYAVRPDSLAVTNAGRTSDGADLFRVEIEAVWFRRKGGETAACIGTLWDFQREHPRDAESFLLRHDDGRYGAACRSRFNGHNLWTTEDLPIADADRAFLQGMLGAYPSIPAGFDGWWTF